jgi:hypothetical protein
VIIFQLDAPDSADYLVLDDDAQAACVHELDGSPRADTWRPPQARIVRPDGGKSRKQPFVSYLHLLTVREDVASELGSFWQANGELLELEIRGGGPRYFVYNARNADALDVSRSKVDANGGGEITYVDSHVFGREMIGDLDLFRLPLSLSSVYATDRFVNAYARSKLRGLSCRRVWADFDGEAPLLPPIRSRTDPRPGKVR